MDAKDLLEVEPWEWPDNAGKIFRKALTDPQAKKSDRLAAAELAGDLVVVNDALVDALLAIVRNARETEEMRAKAAISLGPVLEQADIEEFEEPDEVPITERTFHTIEETLQKLYADSGVPKEVRRRILEASVRAPQEWHADAIRQAYASGDREWILTAVFGMRWVRGFDEQILEALRNPDPEIHLEAVRAAGSRELEGAGPHVVELVKNPATPKELLIAAIEAVGWIRPTEAGRILADLTGSEDEDIAEAVDEAMQVAEVNADDDIDEEDDEEEEDGWVN